MSARWSTRGRESSARRPRAKAPIGSSTGSASHCHQSSPNGPCAAAAPASSRAPSGRAGRRTSRRRARPVAREGPERALRVHAADDVDGFAGRRAVRGTRPRLDVPGGRPSFALPSASGESESRSTSSCCSSTARMRRASSGPRPLVVLRQHEVARGPRVVAAARRQVEERAHGRARRVGRLADGLGARGRRRRGARGRLGRDGCGRGSARAQHERHDGERGGEAARVREHARNTARARRAGQGECWCRIGSRPAIGRGSTRRCGRWDIARGGS